MKSRSCRRFPLAVVAVGLALAAWGAPAGAARQASGSLALPSVPAHARAQDLVAPAGQLWEVRYNGSGNSHDTATAIGVSPDGATVFVTGESTGPGTSRDYGTVAYDTATGTQLWVARYNDPANVGDTATAIGVSPDGATVFVTGASGGSGTGVDYATVAYDAATGAQLWVARYNGPGNGFDQANALGLSPDSATVFVTGYSPGSGTSGDYATVAYDATTGTQLWVARYNGPGNGYDAATALAVRPDGATVFVTGDSPGSASLFDYATVAYDATTGTQLWVARYNGPGSGYDDAYALGVSPDGTTVFVTGASVGSGGTGDDYATVAYDAATGTQLWVARYNGPVDGSLDDAYALGVSPDATTVFVTGRSPGSGSSGDYATVAYDATTGSQLWVARYNGPGNGLDQASALGLSSDGATVFVTGYSLGSRSEDDYATVAYDAGTGQPQGVARFGPGSGTALALSPDGNGLFVTGSVGTSNVDYGTAAYNLVP
jgi:hypothetical protein